MSETLLDLLERAPAMARARDVLRFLDRKERETEVSWAAMLGRARRAAAGFSASGVRPGQRIALILPTGPEFIAALFGCQMVGAVPVPLYPPLRLGRLQEYYDRTAAMLRAVEAAAVVTDARTASLLGQVLLRYRPPLGRILVEKLAGFPVEDRRRRDLPGPDALALVQFSSGTTSRPHPVALTHRQIVACAQAIAQQVAPSGTSYRHAGVSWLPLYHDMGLIGCVFVAVAVPGELTLIPPEAFLAQPALWLRAISRYRATVSPAPNFAYGLCVDRIQDDELAGCDLSSWRLALNGAEAVTAATMRAFQDRFGRWGLRPETLTPVYGLSEATVAVTFSDPLRPYRVRAFRRDALSAGRALPGREVELVGLGRPLPGARLLIRNDDGETLAPERVGRVWVQAPWLMRGYLDGSENPIRDGWLDTGDLGFLLDDELFITGRARDVIVLRGANHSPVEIEDAVDGVEGVRTGCSAAVGEITSDGERLLLFVEVRHPREGLEEDCRRAVLAATGLNPHGVIPLEPGSLPRTSSGKIRRAEALRQWKEGTLQPPESTSGWRMAGEIARNAIASWMGH